MGSPEVEPSEGVGSAEGVGSLDGVGLPERVGSLGLIRSWLVLCNQNH